jgi:hypothetical protein
MMTFSKDISVLKALGARRLSKFWSGSPPCVPGKSEQTLRYDGYRNIGNERGSPVFVKVDDRMAFESSMLKRLLTSESA